jgi:hypothetical protein
LTDGSRPARCIILIASMLANQQYIRLRASLLGERIDAVRNYIMAQNATSNSGKYAANRKWGNIDLEELIRLSSAEEVYFYNVAAWERQLQFLK